MIFVFLMSHTYLEVILVQEKKKNRFNNSLQGTILTKFQQRDLYLPATSLMETAIAQSSEIIYRSVTHQQMVNNNGHLLICSTFL